MGISTPKTGQIAFSDLNDGILNLGSTNQLDMNTAGVRLGYGSTSQLSLSDLRGCTGGQLTIGYRAPDKYIVGGYGYDSLITPYAGSASGVTYRPAPESTYVYAIFDSDANSGETAFSMFNTDFTGPPSGFQGTSVTRACLVDTSRTINFSDTSSVAVSYTMPTSGTISWALKFG